MNQSPISKIDMSDRHWMGGQLALAKAENEPQSAYTVMNCLRINRRTVRWVARASSLGLWWCSEAGTDRQWMAASTASQHPPRTPKAKADEAPPRQTWQPASCGGARISNSESKSAGVYRPGQGAGHACGHPKVPQQRLPFGRLIPM